MKRAIRMGGCIILMAAALLTFSHTSSAQTLDPADFSTEVTNPYFPLPIGAERVFEGTETDPETGERTVFRIEERVLDEQYEVAGIAVVVLEVTEYEDGELIEITRDYHAQHKNGDVWYFGEHVDNYADGVLANHDGTWIAGEYENKPSIFMPAEPQVFDTILQEQAPGEAEDISIVVETGLNVRVAAGEFADCVQTVDVNPLEATSEFKHYCPGSGLVREENRAGATELISIEMPGTASNELSMRSAPQSERSTPEVAAILSQRDWHGADRIGSDFRFPSSQNRYHRLRQYRPIPCRCPFDSSRIRVLGVLRRRYRPRPVDGGAVQRTPRVRRSR